MTTPSSIPGIYTTRRDTTVPRVAAFYTSNSADGLLGRDFLDRFKVVMDPAAGTVTLVPR